MKVLIACEESQRVCIEFRKKGHEAYSCDIQRCSGGHPEWHILENALNVLGGGYSETTKRKVANCWQLGLDYSAPALHISFTRQYSWPQFEKDTGEQNRRFNDSKNTGHGLFHAMYTGTMPKDRGGKSGRNYELCVPAARSDHRAISVR